MKSRKLFQNVVIVVAMSGCTPHNDENGLFSEQHYWA